MFETGPALSHIALGNFVAIRIDDEIYIESCFIPIGMDVTWRSWGIRGPLWPDLEVSSVLEPGDSETQ